MVSLAFNNKGLILTSHSQWSQSHELDPEFSDPNLEHGLTGDTGRAKQAATELIASDPEAFTSGFIAESPERLRELVTYFEAVIGESSFPPVRCNAPGVSAVVEAMPFSI